MSLQNELQAALSAVRLAAKVCESVQAAITDDAMEKKDRSPVTVADFASQAIVCRTLRELFPNDPVIGEEDSAELQSPENAAFLERVLAELSAVDITAEAADVFRWIDHGSAKDFSPRFWTLDPIDGTKGFLRKQQYAISLALIIDGRISVAAVGCPNLPLNSEPNAPGTLGFAVKGEGSQCVAMHEDTSPISARVTDIADPARVRTCESVESGHSSHGHSAQIVEKLGISVEPVRLDSQAKYAVVGRGDAEAYLRLPTRPGYKEKIWDHAGGVLFVEEAGGRVTDIHGKPLEFTHGFELAANRGVIVTNGHVHDAILKTLPEVGVV